LNQSSAGERHSDKKLMQITFDFRIFCAMAMKPDIHSFSARPIPDPLGRGI
jgi:hypothetical protein